MSSPNFDINNIDWENSELVTENLVYFINKILFHDFVNNRNYNKDFKNILDTNISILNTFKNKGANFHSYNKNNINAKMAIGYVIYCLRDYSSQKNVKDIVKILETF